MIMKKYAELSIAELQSEHTLLTEKYNEYKKTKKNKKDVVVTFQTEAGNKKSVKEISAQTLFEDLEKKYSLCPAAVNICATMFSISIPEFTDSLSKSNFL